MFVIDGCAVIALGVLGIIVVFLCILFSIGSGG